MSISLYDPKRLDYIQNRLLSYILLDMLVPQLLRRKFLAEHWISILRLIEPEYDGKAFLCKVCRFDRKIVNLATFRSPNSAANLYTYFRLIQPYLMSTIQLIVATRERNKRENNQLARNANVLGISRQGLVDKGLKSLFLCTYQPNK